MFAPLPVPVEPPPVGVFWTPAQRALPASVTDGKPQTYELLRVGSTEDPVDFGLQWRVPTRVGTLGVCVSRRRGTSRCCRGARGSTRDGLPDGTVSDGRNGVRASWPPPSEKPSP
ncbi:MAG: hypothetical protein FJX72_05925 [Armatimonadetes bacterium]|nr:hypothetical protein [Armatimonadota bacterium]